MADEKKAALMSDEEERNLRMWHPPGCGCGMSRAFATLDAARAELAAETARAEGAERETIAKVVAWLRRGHVAHFEELAFYIERGDWRPK